MRTLVLQHQVSQLHDLHASHKTSSDVAVRNIIKKPIGLNEVFLNNNNALWEKL